MASDLCILIDYATGDNWQMPFDLYERYRVECLSLKPDGQTVVEQWMATLSKEDRTLIEKK